MNKYKISIIVLVIILIGLVAYRYVLPMVFYMPNFLNVSLEIEKTCVSSGGKIVEKRCCENFGNYPVYYAGDQMIDRFRCDCTIGHVIKYCDCENAGASFDGKNCAYDNRCKNGGCMPLLDPKSININNN